MKKVYSSENSVITGHAMSLLEQAGILCELRNQYLSGALGELPAFHCWPEIWIHDDDNYEEAMSIIEQVIKQPVTNTGSWQCQCGEKLEAQFNQCWSCGAER